MLLRLGLLAMGVAASLLLAEVALRIVERRQLGDRRLEDQLIADPRLGKKLAPLVNGHDANGFRNDTLPARADIVAIGDSQTWGVNAARGDAWPQQLAQLTGRSVYSMAMGGFGPVQYWVLIDDALELSPRVVIVGLYLGNDLYDAYHLTYTRDRYAALRDPQAPPAVVHDAVGPRADAIWNQEKAFSDRFGRSHPSQWTYWVRGHTALGRFLNRAHLWPGSTDVPHLIDREWATTFPGHGAVYEHGETRTVFTPAYRLLALDLDEPPIAEGLRISRIALRRIGERTASARCKLLVVLIPTKESVYAEALKDRVVFGDTFGRLVGMERRVRSRLAEGCVEDRLDCVDALPALAAAIRAGQAVYPTTTESHPNARGYLVLARFVAESLSALNW